jgi:NDP-sugar pyrophosphorylase family protein
MLVVIPSAGVGSRLFQRTEHINKTMLLLGNKPVISRIIEAYPVNTKFLIGVGYKGEHISEFIKLAYPQKNITFINIKNYKGASSSLTHTLKIMLKKIKKEFIFHANDTVINFPKKTNFKFDSLFVFNKKIQIDNLYRSIRIKNKHQVKKLLDKKFGLEFPYTGVCYIKYYKTFKSIIKKSNKINGEFEYFEEMLKKQKKIIAHKVKVWHDIGNEENYIKACKFYEKNNYLKKYDETIFFHNQRVIKFFADKTKVRDRYKRSNFLKRIVPKIIYVGRNFYTYNYIKGKILSEKLIDSRELSSLLNWCSKNLFKKINISQRQYKIFRNDCKKFYFYKTINRVKSFRNKTKIIDEEYIINNLKVSKLSHLIKKINWKEIFKGYPSKFHGDFHFENIIKVPKGYKLIDWREKFSSKYLYGDLYYDLAKLNHSFIINHKKIDQRKFKITIKKKNIQIYLERRLDLIKSQKFFYKFLKKNNYNIYVVNVITSLIFLNIAVLHHSPYREFLYFLGLHSLKKTIDNHEIIL